jgi:hypothetical protein
MVHNYNCDGGNCTTEDGEVRRLPCGRSLNLILCRECYDREMDFRQRRNTSSGKSLFQLPKWEELKVVE